jgi:hypothetical protein
MKRVATDEPVQTPEKTITKQSRTMRRKHLESALSSVQREFPNPNVDPSRFVWFVVVLIHSAAAAARVGPLSISSHDLTPQRYRHCQNVCIYQKTGGARTIRDQSPFSRFDDTLCARTRGRRSRTDLGCGTGMLAIAWQVSLLFFERTASWPGADCGWWGDANT